MKNETANQKRAWKIYSSHYAHDLIQKHFPNEYREIMEAVEHISLGMNRSDKLRDQRISVEKLKQDLQAEGWKEMAISIDMVTKVTSQNSCENQKGTQKTEVLKKNLLKTRIPFAKDHLALYILENRIGAGIRRF